ncbi:MAG: leucine--tRNA ligase [Patescibacteria group bacterium]|nr:MAG: leucine--tRNA ligase [Patescibacteria group bacterium]
MTKKIVLKTEEDCKRFWLENRIYDLRKVPSDKNNKQYVLVMFPYPSGQGLHMGHTRIYTGGDVLARYFRMKGFDVLNPIGWDAFGLPAENYALKNKTTPQKIVPENILNFKRQILDLGLSYDWSREFSTTDPEYYRFTQFLFTIFFKMGLLYKDNLPVYFCPYCKTGLAEEEVLSDGTHERCGEKITRKLLPQWLFKITDYAESLLSELDNLDWPEGIKDMQRNWIGKSEGAEIKFQIDKNGLDLELSEIVVFTTRPDTIYGATALVIAPEHPLVKNLLNSEISDPIKQQISEYVKKSSSKLDLNRTDLNQDKSGIFSGIYAIHPLTQESIPIWIADYVIGWYGRGAIMLVPAHDERDYQFAKKYNIPIKKVIKPRDDVKGSVEPYTDYGVLENSGEFDGLSSKSAIEQITKKLEDLNKGSFAVEYKLRDWIFSRQRYWGEPIPMVFCESCAKNKIAWIDTDSANDEITAITDNTKVVDIINDRWNKIKKYLYGWFPLKLSDLPLLLPDVDFYELTETGESPLANITDWVSVSCPNCGKPAKRETDTMPNWAGSSWYFLAFCFWDLIKDKTLKIDLLDFWKNKVVPRLEKFMPVDWYLGGAEHAVLHLLYSRFWMHALYEVGLVPEKEPFLRLRNVGMVLAEDHKKMSKSRGNVVNPDDFIREYNADIVRVCIMFIAPFSQEVAWSKDVIKGVGRFIKKIYQTYLVYDNSANIVENNDKKIFLELQRLISKVDSDLSAVKFNTAIASLMEFLNLWTDYIAKFNKTGLSRDNAKKYLKLLSPFAPFISDIIWSSILKEEGSIHTQKWPELNMEDLVEEEFDLPIQVNGKLRSIIRIKRNLSKQDIEKIVLSDNKIMKYIKNRNYELIYIPNKIVNLVVK